MKQWSWIRGLLLVGWGIMVAGVVTLVGCSSAPKGASIIATRTAIAFFIHETPVRPAFPTMVPFKTAPPEEPIFSPTPTPTLPPTPTYPTVVEPMETSVRRTLAMSLARLPPNVPFPFEVYPTLTPLPFSLASPTPIAPLPTQPISIQNLDQLRLVGEIGYGQAQDAAVRPGSNALAIATTAGIAWALMPTMQIVRFTPFEGGIDDLVFSPTGQFLAATRQTPQGPQTLLLRSSDMVVLAQLEGSTPVFRPDERSIATTRFDGQAAATWIWACPSGMRQATVVGHEPHFSPTGELLATEQQQVGRSTTTLVWRSNDGALLQEIPGHASAFSPDGVWIATATDHTVTVSNVFRGAKDKPLVVAEGVSVESLRFSSDGRLLYMAGPTSLHIWQVTNKTLSTHPTAGGAFANVGEILVRSLGGGARETGIRLTRASDGHILYETPDEVIPRDRPLHRAVHLSTDAISATMVSSRGLVRVVNLTSGSRSDLLMPGIEQMALSPDGKTLATASNGSQVRLWPLAHGGYAQRQLSVAWEPSPDRTVHKVAFTPDGNGLILEEQVGGGTTLSGHITVATWDILTDTNQLGHEVWSLNLDDTPEARPNTPRAYSTAIRAIGWVNQHREVCLKHRDGGVMTLTDPGTYTTMEFSPNGQFLAVGDSEGTVQIFKTHRGYLHDTFSVGGGVLRLAYHPDGTLLSIHRVDGMIQVWHVYDRALLFHIAATVDSRSSFSPDKQCLIVSSNEGVKFYRVEDGQLLYQIGYAAQYAAFSSTRHVLALLHGKRVTLWGAP